MGGTVKLAEARGVALSELSVGELKKLEPEFGRDVKEVFDFVRSMQTREIVGSTGPNMVREQIARTRALIEK